MTAAARSPTEPAPRVARRSGHVWAITYDDMDGAERAKQVLLGLGWDQHYVNLVDVIVVVRRPDGTFVVENEPFPTTANLLGCTTLGFIAGAVLAAPLVGAAVGAFVGAASSALARCSVMADDFVREVQAAVRPGTSALLLLAGGADVPVVVRRIRGLGGTVFKTNVDLEQARAIQESLRLPSGKPDA